MGQLQSAPRYELIAKSAEIPEDLPKRFFRDAKGGHGHQPGADQIPAIGGTINQGREVSRGNS